MYISMGWCKKDVTPLLTHWSYIFPALTHRYTTPAVPFVYLINILNHIHLSSVPPIHLCMNSQLPSPIHPSYFLSFHISTLSSSLLSFWDPAIQPCVHPSINYPLGITPTLYPLITPPPPPPPPPLLSIHPFVLSPPFPFFGSINAFKLSIYNHISGFPSTQQSIHPSVLSQSFLFRIPSLHKNLSLPSTKTFILRPYNLSIHQSIPILILPSGWDTGFLGNNELPWLQSPGHEQPWYGLCRINRYHGCWCPGSSHQAMNSLGMDYAG